MEKEKKNNNKGKNKNNNKNDNRNSNNNNLIVIFLLIIIAILLVVSTALYMKNEYLEDKYDDDRFIVNDNQSNDKENVNDDTKNKYISSSKASDIALSSIGVNKNDVYELSSELEYKYGTNVYDVDFKYNRYEYEFYIDAVTGKILKSFREWD